MIIQPGSQCRKASAWGVGECPLGPGAIGILCPSYALAIPRGLYLFALANRPCPAMAQLFIRANHKGPRRAIISSGLTTKGRKPSVHCTFN